MTPIKPSILPCPSNSLRASLLSLGVALLPDATIDQLATASSRLLSPPNSILFREGESQPFLFLIESGQIELSMRAPGRPNVRILSLCNGNILAWSALLNQQPMTCSATTLSDCELLRIPATSLLETISAFPSFGVRFLHQINLALSERLTATRLQLLDLYHPHNA
jgi:CRP-like cAMP-binding protein